MSSLESPSYRGENDKAKFKILVSDPIDNEGLLILERAGGGTEVDVLTKLPEDELCRIIGKYDALMIRSGTTVTRKVIEASENLKIIGRAGVGVDNVAVKAATEKGIYVVNSPLGNTVAAAELTLGLMFSLVRHIPKGDASIRGGKWERSLFLGTELYQKTLGIVGLGQVGSHVARVAKAAGMHLLAYDPYVNETKAKMFEVQMVDLETLLKQSDIVTLHVPLVAETKGLINRESLKLMQPNARIVNVSRGGVVDEDALAEALKERSIAGAALDVFETEKAFPLGHTLLNCPNLILTPHLGASTEEAQKSVATDVARQIVCTLQGGIPNSAVNTPIASTPDDEEFALMKCAESIGKIAAQMLDGPLERIEVVLEGQFADQRSEPILLAVANGALGVHTDSRVNYVNVRNIAKNYQISLIVSKDARKIKAGVRVQMGCCQLQRCVSVVGSITAEGAPLLKSIQRMPVFLIIPSDSKMLYCEIIDKPQTMSLITTVLGNNNVNIANCHLGRVSEEKRSGCSRVSSVGDGPMSPPLSPLSRPQDDISAVALFHVDDLNIEVIEKIRNLEVIKKCVFFCC